MNDPPFVPVTELPTLPANPFTAETTRLSPSGSESTPLPSLSVITFPDNGAFSVVVKSLSVAVGPGFVTVQTNDCVTDAPLASVAVITTEYGLPTEASALNVPVICPAELIDNPGGSVPPSLNVSTSVASTSVKNPLTFRVAIVVASTPDCGPTVPSAVGASFVPVTVTVTVATLVPP
nr:hypothetical protein [Stieleria varia]